VTRGHTPPEEPAYREAQEDDRAQLVSFECSTGTAFEDEVQAFIQEQALDHALNPTQHYTLLVFMAARRLVAVAGFHPELLIIGPPASPEPEARIAIRLSVVAIHLADQGSVLGDGRRLSDLVMQTLIATAIAQEPVAILTGIVARDNARSLALCERNGLVSRTQYDHRHDRMSGIFQRR
jgi:hypothetical protein